MKILKTILVATGIIAAASILRIWLDRQSRRAFVKTTEDFTYSAVSPDMLAANDLLDLNVTGVSDLLELGVEAEMADRIIENRPFRNKLELLSRRIVTEEVYERIKDRVAVANANDAIKIA
jgi:DNA uptake protein ComE-like DNA-binding protein